ncbi:hypothetical protein, partial [Roseateles sp. P5_E11]
NNRRELIVLITPYILNDTRDAELMTEAFRKSLGPWAERAQSVIPSERSTPAEPMPLPPAETRIAPTPLPTGAAASGPTQ